MVEILILNYRRESDANCIWLEKKANSNTLLVGSVILPSPVCVFTVFLFETGVLR